MEFEDSRLLDEQDKREIEEAGNVNKNEIMGNSNANTNKILESMAEQISKLAVDKIIDALNDDGLEIAEYTKTLVVPESEKQGDELLHDLSIIDEWVDTLDFEESWRYEISKIRDRITIEYWDIFYGENLWKGYGYFYLSSRDKHRTIPIFLIVDVSNISSYKLIDFNFLFDKSPGNFEQHIRSTSEVVGDIIYDPMGKWDVYIYGDDDKHLECKKYNETRYRYADTNTWATSKGFVYKDEVVSFHTYQGYDDTYQNLFHAVDLNTGKIREVKIDFNARAYRILHFNEKGEIYMCTSADYNNPSLMTYVVFDVNKLEVTRTVKSPLLPIKENIENQLPNYALKKYTVQHIVPTYDDNLYFFHSFIKSDECVFYGVYNSSLNKIVWIKTNSMSSSVNINSILANYSYGHFKLGKYIYIYDEYINLKTGLKLHYYDRSHNPIPYKKLKNTTIGTFNELADEFASNLRYPQSWGAKGSLYNCRVNKTSIPKQPYVSTKLGTKVLQFNKLHKNTEEL